MKVNVKAKHLAFHFQQLHFLPKDILHIQSDTQNYKGMMQGNVTPTFINNADKCKCQTCGMKFKNKIILNRHMVIHNGKIYGISALDVFSGIDR